MSIFIIFIFRLTPQSAKSIELIPFGYASMHQSIMRARGNRENTNRSIFSSVLCEHRNVTEIRNSEEKRKEHG
uniref:Putative secreted protein n=1 Tax=Anopheles darlingi TaxID=43151 RepID=A0A2M4DCV2_ANODA